MSWFFPISKVFGFLTAPSHVLLWLVLGAAGCSLLGEFRTARVLAAAAAAIFVLVGVAPSGLLLARPLENRYPRLPLPSKIEGVVTLGGGLKTAVLMARGAPGTSPSIDRIVSTYELARRHPEARIVFSGGWGTYSDAIAARDDFLRIGLDPGRLVLEGRSRNTFENLLYTKAAVHPRPEESWVLATSAIQLPRAMNVANRLGWTMIPWPTDYKTASGYPRPEDWFQIGENLRSADEAAHEWIGLAGYAITGLARGGSGRTNLRPAADH